MHLFPLLLIKLFNRRFDDTVVRLARRAKRALPKDHKTGEGDVINGNDEVLTTCWNVKGVTDRWEDYYHIGHREPTYMYRSEICRISKST